MATETKFSLSTEQKALLDGATKKTKPTEYLETGNVGLDLA
jgi:hypothetical protein